jgi:hypothetical protein
MTRYDKMLQALICPCGECGIDPTSWECASECSAEELEKAEKAYKEFKEIQNARKRN